MLGCNNILLEEEFALKGAPKVLFRENDLEGLSVML